MTRRVGWVVVALTAAATVLSCGTNFEKPDAGEYGSDGGGNICKPKVVETLRNPVYMLIVLDGSGSMSGEKWDAATGSLKTFFGNLGAAPDNRTAIGFTIFSDQNDKGSKNKYVDPDVPIANVDSNQASALVARMTTTPTGGTPSRTVLTGQYPIIDAYDPATQPPLLLGGKKVLVFISDGVPTDVTDPNLEVYQMVARYHQVNNVLTFSVGVGALPGDPMVYDPRFMGMIAVAGGTPKPGCDPNENALGAKMCHFQITPGAGANLGLSFKNAINGIRGAVSSCTFEIDPAVGAIDPSTAQVVLRSQDGGDTYLNQDPSQGACFNSPTQATKVTLAGDPCDKVHSGTVDVKILLGCVPDGGLGGPVCGTATDTH